MVMKSCLIGLVRLRQGIGSCCGWIHWSPPARARRHGWARARKVLRDVPIVSQWGCCLTSEQCLDGLASVACRVVAWRASGAAGTVLMGWA